MEHKWRTKDGQVMLMSEMTDSHLDNAIKYLDRVCQDDMVESPDWGDSWRVDVYERRQQLIDFGYYKLLAEKRRRLKQ